MTDPIDDPKAVRPEDIDPVAFAGLTLMRRLVTVLLGVMILGFLVLIALLVTRFPQMQATNTGSISFELPEQINLPAGVEAQSFTRGADWVAIVTTLDEILIFDAQSGGLRQVVQITSP